jgi:hypothetical protein
MEKCLEQGPDGGGGENRNKKVARGEHSKATFVTILFFSLSTNIFPPFLQHGS